MNKITVVILIDGLRHDYLNLTDSPFLYSLANKGISGIVQETFAFQLRLAFFAGLYPESCDVGHLYWCDPETSPFKLTKYIPEVALRIPKLGGYYKRFLGKYAKSVERRRGNSASARYAELSQIPYNLLKYFGFSEKRLPWEPGVYGNNTTLFDILKENRLNWLWIAYPTDDQNTDSIVHNFKKRIHKNHSLVYLHFAELDWIGHIYGPHSSEQRKILRAIDSAIEETYLILREIFDDVNGLLFGDHGMVEVTKSVDIEEKISKTGLKLEKDFIYFLDSTQARFWFKKPRSKDVIKDVLQDCDKGKILVKEDYDRLRFRFSHNKFGELIFVVNDNTIIFPNFFQRTDCPKGMHGYLPDVKGNWSWFIVTGVNVTRRLDTPLKMVDLFPIILELMSLSIPKTCQGKNILKRLRKQNIMLKMSKRTG